MSLLDEGMNVGVGVIEQENVVEREEGPGKGSRVQGWSDK